MKTIDSLSDFQRGNLATLSAYLKSPHKPPPSFGMNAYFTNLYNPHVTHHLGGAHFVVPGDTVVYHVCGTSACAAGHGPLAGIEGLPGEEWLAYVRRCFTGDSPTELNRQIASYKIYDWLFSGCWSGIDDTRLGAAARIDYLLAYGDPPPMFYTGTGTSRQSRWQDEGFPQDYQDYMRPFTVKDNV